MGQSPDNFLFETSLESSNDNKNQDFYFDDEPLERILYGDDLNGPSPANLYAPSHKYVQKIITSCKERNLADLISALSALAKDNLLISTGVCHLITDAIGELFPYYPNPIVVHDITNLEPLLVNIWGIALEKQEVSLLSKVGTPLFRWYEHHGKYEDARRILNKLIETSRERNDRVNEALHLNNFAFEYLLEKRWSDAISHFVASAALFEQSGIPFEAVNARANYWICRFELDDVDDLESAEAELNEISKVFNGAKRWYERKSLILFAKIEERRGNIAKAINLVERAIESAKESHTKYPEIDRNYLEQLMLKRKGT
jgi:tetratricopeptide (TPR) repeat protein